jgi:hypothetical protein
MSEPNGAPDGSLPRRSAERIPLRADIHLRKSGYHRTGVILHDLSNTGCRVELPERVTEGEMVWVSFPGLESIEARVAWSDNWIAGLKFTKPIHPAVFDTLVPRIAR